MSLTPIYKLGCECPTSMIGGELDLVICGRTTPVPGRRGGKLEAVGQAVKLNVKVATLPGDSVNCNKLFL